MGLGTVLFLTAIFFSAADASPGFAREETPLTAAYRAGSAMPWMPEPAGAPWTEARRDCVGFALRYRRHLLDTGFTPADLTLANIPAGGARHAVLLVRWQGRTWKLDQREVGPVPWTPPAGPWWPMVVAVDGALAPVPVWAMPRAWGGVP